MKEKKLKFSAVTPHAGVWIETICEDIVASNPHVTPHAGVWIETSKACRLTPSAPVTPHAGVWIETAFFKSLSAG